MDFSRDRSTDERRYWRFAFPAAVVLEAARRKREHHQERWGWWNRELDEAEADLKERGVEFREFQGTQIAGHGRIEASLDTGLSRRVSECRDGVNRHQEAIRNLEAYVTALSATDAETTLQLTVADIEFFGMGADDA